MLGGPQTSIGPVTLDFGTGLIRHAVTVDHDGFEWSHDVVDQVGATQSSETDTLNGEECWFNVFHVIRTVTHNI